MVQRFIISVAFFAVLLVSGCGDDRTITDYSLKTEYHNCTILSLKDWECSYSDGSGKFGFRNGEYWELPVWSDVKHVSKLEYNLVRCDWAINDEHEGYFWGAIRCIVGWD